MSERSLIAAKFRSLADQFNAYAACEFSKLGWQHLHTKLEAGKLLIRAYRQGYLPALPGLAEKVELAEDSQRPGGTGFTPDILFTAFSGTNHAVNIDLRIGHECTYIQPDAQIGHCILADAFPEVLMKSPVNSVATRERHHAMVCNWLADAVGAPATTELDEWSFPATWKEWLKRFKAADTTMRGWIREKDFRMKKAATSGYWVVHKEEPRYVEWEKCDKVRAKLTE